MACKTLRSLIRVACSKRVLWQQPAPSFAQHHSSVASYASLTQDRLDDIAYGFMASQALFAGLDLNIFDAISKLNSDNNSNCTLNNICNELKLDIGSQSDKIGVLLDSLLKLNLIQTSDDSSSSSSSDSNETRFKNNEITEKFLVSMSKHYYGDYYKIQISKLMYPRMGHLTKVLNISDDKKENSETGSSATNQNRNDFEDFTYKSWFENKTNAKLYSLSQHNGSLGVGSLIYKNNLLDMKNINNDANNNIKLIDLGGGTGAVSIKLCEKYTNLRSFVVDLDNVILTAKEHILPNLNKNVKERLQYFNANVLAYNHWVTKFEKENVNFVLLSYLLVSIPHAEFVPLFKHIKNVLNITRNNDDDQSQAPKRLIIHDFIQNMVDTQQDEMQQNESYLTSLWTLQHVTVNPGVTLLTFQKLQPLLTEAGFTNIKICSGLSRLTMFITADVA